MKFQFITIVFSIALSANIALANDTQCSTIKSEKERLSCYDSMASSNKNDNVGTGDWIIKDQINPINDTKSVIVGLRPHTGKNKYGNAPALMFRCINGETDALVAWHAFISNKETNVTTRIGDDEAETLTWRISRDYKQTGHPKPIEFIREVMKADKLVIQVSPYSDSSITTIYDTTGLENAIKPLRDVCDW